MEGVHLLLGIGGMLLAARTARYVREQSGAGEVERNVGALEAVRQ